MSDNIKDLEIYNMGTVKTGRKNDSIVVQSRHNDLAEMMAQGYSNLDILKIYKEKYKLSESQYYQDKRKVLEILADELDSIVENPRQFATQIFSMILKSIKDAQIKGVPSAQQSGIAMLVKMVEAQRDMKNRLDEKQDKIIFEIDAGE